MNACPCCGQERPPSKIRKKTVRFGNWTATAEMCSAHGTCETWLVFVTDDLGVGHIFPASGGLRIMPSDSELHRIIDIFRSGHDDAECHALKLELGYEAPESSTCPVAASHDAQWLAEPYNIAPEFAPPVWKILTRQLNGPSYLFPHEGHFLKEPSAEMLRASIKAAGDVAKSSDNAGSIVRALEREFVSIQAQLAERRLAIIDSVLPTKVSGEALRDLAKVYGVDPDMVSTVYRGGPDPEQADDLLREKIMAKLRTL